MGKSRGKILIDGNNFFCSNQRNGTNNIEKHFPPKNWPLTAKLSFFWWFEAFLRKWLKTLVGVLKVTISERCQELLWNYFSQLVENGQITRNTFDFMETKKILSNYWNGTNIIKNGFPLPNEPYTDKLSLLGVLKPLRRNWLKTSILG